MPSKVFSAAISNLEAKLIEVEIAGYRGLRSFEIVGLADKAVEESKERVNAALKSGKFSPPHQTNLRILVNLAPADLKKEGCLYDLPIALGFLLESKQVKFSSANKIFIGELSLDGRVRSVKGTLPITLLASGLGIEEIILPKNNALEAALAGFGAKKKLKIVGVKTLKEAVEYLEGKKEILCPDFDFDSYLSCSDYPIDLAWIHGQEYAKRALEIVSAGGHHLLMAGPPGGGKTILAKAIISILPKLSFEESLEVTKIYSIAGLLPPEKPLINSRPFRAPHHTTSEAALIGGGNPPRPGEITLAHRGVLFLDEFPEFHRDALESLRQPIEDGEITVLRAKASLTLPARFTLIAASNPCPCGYKDDPQRECHCSSSQIAKYQRKLSGPLIDRIDLFINVPQVKYDKLISNQEEEASLIVRQRIERAREIQKQRFSGSQDSDYDISGNPARYKKNLQLTNAEIDLPQIKKFCQIDSAGENLLRKCVDSGALSARGYHRVLKTARTIADLEESEKILFGHVSEALSYRVRE